MSSYHRIELADTSGSIPETLELMEISAMDVLGNEPDGLRSNGMEGAGRGCSGVKVGKDLEVQVIHRKRKGKV
jgi:hypothetical protein